MGIRFDFVGRKYCFRCRGRFEVFLLLHCFGNTAAALVAQFPRAYSGDPADRIIGGTARSEELTLITHDEKIRRSPLLQTVW